MNSYSLRRRLLMWLLLPLLAIGLIALLDAYNSARQTADEISDRVLAGSALAIAERIFVNDEGKLDVDIPYVALEMLTSAEDDRVFYMLEGANKLFVTGYRKLNIPNEFDRVENEIQFVNSTFKGFPIRLAVLENAASSSTISLDFRLAIAETTNARNKMASDILVRSAARQGLLILTAIIAVWLAVSRALLPLYKIRDAIGRRSTDDLRPILHHVPKEIEGLVFTTNDLLSRIGTNLSALKNFTTNASHQLRTPLTVMHTHVELAKRSKDKKTRDEALNHIDDAVKDAEKVVSRLLILARMDSAVSQNLQKTNCDISDIAKNICTEFISQQNALNIDLGFEGDDNIQVIGDAILYGEMLKNLIDNAIKHGAKTSRASLKITVRCKKQNNNCILQIEDNGAGLTATQKIDLMSRFSRGENKSDLASDGLGVGLPIAREIAELFGGSLSLLNPSSNEQLDDGLIVQIKLRLASAV